MLKALIQFLVSFVLFFLLALYFFASSKTHNILSKVNEFSLDNGISVLHIKNEKVPAILLMFWVKAGAVDEQDKKSGVAHFLEHVMFHGTDKYQESEFRTLLEKNGGYQNAFTAYDHTAYFSYFPKRFLEEAIIYEADRFKNLRFDAKKIANEKKVILEERLWRMDNDIWQSFYLKLKNNQYGSSYPYSKPLIGYKDEIMQTDIADLRYFYEKYYQPNNIFIIVAGDVTQEILQYHLNAYLANWQGKELVKQENFRAEPKEIIREFDYYEERSSNYVYMRQYRLKNGGEIAPKYSNSLTLLAKLLSVDEHSVLNQEFVVKRKLLREIQVSYEPYSRGEKYLNIAMIADDKEKLEKAVLLFDQEIENIVKQIDNRDYKIMREKLYKSSLYSLESYKSLGFLIGRPYANSLTLAEIKKRDRQLLLIKLADIRKVALEVFGKGDYVAGFMNPKN